MELSSALLIAIAALILILYSFHAKRTHAMLAEQFASQQKALDRQSEAMERIAAALENPKH